MNFIIKNLWPIVLAGIFVIFAIGIYFSNNNGIFKNIGDKLLGVHQEAQIVDITEMVSGTEVAEEPVLKYYGSARKVGEVVPLSSLFEMAGSEDLIINLKGIQNKSGNNVVEFLKTEEIESMEEISSAFIYDIEQKLLYFHKSGIYNGTIEVYTEHGNRYYYEFLMPVEVGL